MARPTGRDLRKEVLEEARSLIQSHGVSGFSYRDLAAALDVKAPSIHHHFRSKDDLIAAVAIEYREQFENAVDMIASTSTLERLVEYTELFSETARDDRMCLCGVAAVEWSSIGIGARREVGVFVDRQIDWLTATLRTGQQAGDISEGIEASRLAETLFSTLEGSLVVARSSGRPDTAKASMRLLLQLTGARAS